MRVDTPARVAVAVLVVVVVVGLLTWGLWAVVTTVPTRR